MMSGRNLYRLDRDEKTVSPGKISFHGPYPMVYKGFSDTASAQIGRKILSIRPVAPQMMRSW